MSLLVPQCASSLLEGRVAMHTHNTPTQPACLTAPPSCARMRGRTPLRRCQIRLHVTDWCLPIDVTDWRIERSQLLVGAVSTTVVESAMLPACRVLSPRRWSSLVSVPLGNSTVAGFSLLQLLRLRLSRPGRDYLKLQSFQRMPSEWSGASWQ